MKISKTQLFIGLFGGLVTQAVLADVAFQATAQPSIKLEQSIEGEWRLQAHQADLTSLVDKIASQAHLTVHYSVLPAATVSATCIGSTVVALLQCVFSGSANIVSRALNSNAIDKGEIWIISSSLAVGQSVNRTCQNGQADSSEVDTSDQTEKWLKQAIGKNADERAQAVAELGLIHSGDDAKVRGVLQTALQDIEPKVRARAIAAWVDREGEMYASEQLRKALQDHNVDVRFSAIDMIEKDETLLQLAVHDKEQSIREMARLKLDLLTQIQ